MSDASNNVCDDPNVHQLHLEEEEVLTMKDNSSAVASDEEEKQMRGMVLVENLLDRFPLHDEWEVEQLVSLYHRMHRSSTTDTTTIGVHQDNNNHSTNNRKIHPDSLPELDQILHRSMENVFVITNTTTSSDEQEQRRDRFFEAAVSLLGRRGERYLIDAMFDVGVTALQQQQQQQQQKSNDDDHDINTACTKALIDFVYRVAMVAVSLSATTTTTIETNRTKPSCHSRSRRCYWTQDSLSKQITISRQEWKQFISTKAPNLHYAFATVFYRTVFQLDSETSRRSGSRSLSSNCSPIKSSQLQFLLPVQYKTGQTRARLVSNPMGTTNTNNNVERTLLQRTFTTEELISFSAMGLGGIWHNIYNSDEDGLSFRTFQEKLLSYVGPTMIYIRTTTTSSSSSFGYVTHGVPWKESRNWYTNEEFPDSFLFRLNPHWNVYPIQQQQPSSTTASLKYHQFLNMESCTLLTKPELKGLAVGGVDSISPRLHLNEDLEHCIAGTCDFIFEEGPLLADDSSSGGGIFFDVDLLQVWAIGSSTTTYDEHDASYEKHFQSGKLNASLREEYRVRLAQVDKRQFVEDFISGTYANTLFNHRDQTRGRADYVAHDDARQGYYIEGKRPSVANIEIPIDNDNQNDDGDEQGE